MKRYTLVTAFLLFVLPACASAQTRLGNPAVLRNPGEAPVVVLLAPEEVQAPIVNPNLAVFASPSDYATTTNFVLEIYRQSDNVLVRSTDIGKPTPNGLNDIAVPLVKAGLQNNVVHVFRILQINPIGSTRSATTSNPFVMGDLPVGVTNLRAQ